MWPKLSMAMFLCTHYSQAEQWPGQRALTRMTRTAGTPNCLFFKLINIG